MKCERFFAEFQHKSTISRHIGNVFNKGELEPHSVVAKCATTASDNRIFVGTASPSLHIFGQFLMG